MTVFSIVGVKVFTDQMSPGSWKLQMLKSAKAFTQQPRKLPGYVQRSLVAAFAHGGNTGVSGLETVSVDPFEVCRCTVTNCAVPALAAKVASPS